VARLLGRERNPYEHTLRAYAPALIGYTTKRDAIAGSARSHTSGTAVQRSLGQVSSN
jgi:hypothetical protein